MPGRNLHANASKIGELAILIPEDRVKGATRAFDSAIIDLVWLCTPD
jgi:hypothetical protein